ncbi:hypothetical protein VNO78_26907 [Psophocarpus tetragonolobus]|uniref:Uncharacterized protein n=1 Tax=Psophocarpus tetragonolobus TaxID=3891 RepID=A0AAN9S2H2_PSOTE
MVRYPAENLAFWQLEFPVEKPRIKLNRYSLVFENYKSLDKSSFSGIIEVFRPATDHAAPALEPAVKLYKLLHDNLLRLK